MKIKLDTSIQSKYENNTFTLKEIQSHNSVNELVTLISKQLFIKFTNAYIYDHIILYVNNVKLDKNAKLIDFYKKADQHGILVKFENTILLNICNKFKFYMPFKKGERALKKIKSMISYDMV